MAEIDISKIIGKYDDDTFFECKKHLNNYLKFYYMDCVSSNKGLFIEKTYDHIQVIKAKNNMTFGKLLLHYIDYLYSLINGKAEKNSRASKYLEKAKSIVQKMKKSEKGIAQRDIDDFTRIFLCFYTSYLKAGKNISTLSFFIEDVEFKKIIKDMTKEEKGLIHALGKSNTKNIYSKDSFVIIFLTLIYLRIKNNAPESEA